MMGLVFFFQLNEAQALTKDNDVKTTHDTLNTVVKPQNKSVMSPSKAVHTSTTLPQNKKAISNQVSKSVVPKVSKPQLPAQTSKTVSNLKSGKTSKSATITKSKPVQPNVKTPSKAVSKTSKPQLLTQTTKAASNPKNEKTPRIATITKSKPVQPSVKTTAKTLPKTTTSSTNKNYYNQPPKRWPSNVPGGENVRDFGQTTKESGLDDALKIMKKSGNKGVTIEHAKPKYANIATVYNWNPTAKTLTYGTGTAIGKHTILTANHVVNDQRAHRPLSPSQPQNMRVNLLQEGSKVAKTLEVFGVQMLQNGDVALVYTYEDISKYMPIRKIASEKTIKSLKANTPIHMYHYGAPSGQYKNDPAGTMYHSKGKYSMTARNVNPIGYYQMMAEPGSSGAAVLNDKNEVLGIHAFRVDSGEYKTYHLNTMAEIRGNLRKEILDNIV
ncbi:trypsin-like serine protease [Staphylococcus croceilyticus]|uniref:Serine protease n=1 Tax=Staphylococcus croceilyticus TaxID=319942 RepID=A0ABY2KG85_9STAP|nr:trypsin-like peptidase domain-containing protein [Staphylococcus croceilyticus]PNZ69686.1 serine protease [Staphylococcus croceilyticus]TGA81092.1 trypsin-like serine protease [Staphylococcus croceilyticus]